MMQKVMFVCLGNICRSPLAHAVFENIVKKRIVKKSYLVDSSGITDYHVGEPADPRMRATARAHGVEIDHLAQQLKRQHLEHFDRVVCMDYDNREGALALDENKRLRNKICMLRDFDPQGRGDVPDPYYGGDRGFEEVFEIVSRSCEALFEKLEKSE
ncbi:MAG: low molecular weight phosphotyrosine protein phosphatase [Proteobacteria bacterium]|nr:low molecular weight phosphotyrosine protein phosphatase [Pseudomonadota bacterium]